MKMLDLFSGIGGFHLGLEQAGFKFDWVGFSEIDKYAKATYSKNFPDAVDLGDVRTIRHEDLPKIDIITFGSPCQDFSIAGKRAGLEGNRSSLIGEAIRLIADCKPHFFIWENVKGTLSSNNGADFWAIIQAFTDIGGYRLEWQLLNTRWFLPQNRERIYLVGCLGGGSGSKVFPIGESGSLTNNGNTEVANTLQHPGHSGGNYRGMTMVSELKQVGNVDKRGHNSIWGRVYDPDGISTTINSEGGGMGAKTGLYQVTKDDGTAYCHDAHNSQAVEVIEDFYPDRIRTFQESPTLRSDRSGLKVSNNTQIRRLTPTECERLQGFPDGWTEGQSDTQRYKQLGNAVSVPVVKAVGERLIDQL